MNKDRSFLNKLVKYKETELFYTISLVNAKAIL